MNRGGIFWGGLLILLGVLFLLNSLGILTVNVWAVFWPVALILFGLSLLIGVFGRSRSDGRTGNDRTENLALQLKGFEEADVDLHFGGGRLTIESGAAPDELLSGSFGGGVEHELGQQGEKAVVVLRSPENLGAWDGREWRLALNDAIPLSLNLHTGASEVSANLVDTRAGQVSVRAGAGRVDLTLPAAGETTAYIEGGAGVVSVRVPEGVAAHVEGMAVLGALNVDEERFPRVGSGWQSANYDEATNRATIRVRFGAGEVKVF